LALRRKDAEEGDGDGSDEEPDQPLHQSLLMQGDNLAVAKRLIDELDLSDVKDTKKNYQTHAKAAATRATKKGLTKAEGLLSHAGADAGDGKSTAASSSSRAGKVPCPAISSATASKEELRALCPDVKGASVFHEKHWHNRWTATYPSGAPSHSKSCVWGVGSELSERLALKTVLRWMWSRHVECTGQECPYDFDAL
jgi:hypothetical protein